MDGLAEGMVEDAEECLQILGEVDLQKWQTQLGGNIHSNCQLGG